MKKWRQFGGSTNYVQWSNDEGSSGKEPHPKKLAAVPTTDSAAAPINHHGRLFSGMVWMDDGCSAMGVIWKASYSSSSRAKKKALGTISNNRWEQKVRSTEVSYIK